MKYIAILDNDGELSKKAIEELKDTLFVGNESAPYCFEMMSVMKTSEPKTGHWKETGNVGHIDIDKAILYQEMCDKCKGLSYFRKSANKLIGAKNCPNCGAKMEG